MKNENGLLDRKRAWLRLIANETGPGASRMATLESLTFLTGVDGVGAPPIKTIAEKRSQPASYNTVARHLVWFVEKGILKKETVEQKGFPRRRTPPNRYILLGLNSIPEDVIAKWKWKNLQRESW